MANYDVKIMREGDTRFLALRTLWRVQLRRGAYSLLLAEEAVKDYVKNENRLRNGAQYFVTDRSTRIRERDIELPCIMEAGNIAILLQNLKSLTTYLKGHFIYMQVPRLDTVYKLVYTGLSNFAQYNLSNATFTLRFKEPDPSSRTTVAQANLNLLGNNIDENV